LIPNKEECQQIFIEAFNCDNSCMTTGKCPLDMHRKISEAMVKNAENEMFDTKKNF